MSSDNLVGLRTLLLIRKCEFESCLEFSHFHYYEAHFVTSMEPEM